MEIIIVINRLSKEKNSMVDVYPDGYHIGYNCIFHTSVIDYPEKKFFKQKIRNNPLFVLH